MKILLTGGAGFIGSHIAEQLVAGGHKVTIIDNLSTGKKENLDLSKVCLVRADIGNTEVLDNVMRGFRPDVICHQAAQPSLLRSCDDPAFDAQVNIVGSLNLIVAAKEYGVSQFVFASTSAVFSKHVTQPVEATPTCPERPYGIAKATVEKYLAWSGLNYTILRYGNVYGPRQVPIGENQLIAKMFSFIYCATPFRVYGNGMSERDYIYVDDVARANLVVIDKRLTGIFHVGWGDSCTVRGVIQAAHPYLLGNKIPRGRAIKDEPKVIALCSTRWKETGDLWRPAVKLEAGLKKTNAWWKEKTQC